MIEMCWKYFTLSGSWDLLWMEKPVYIQFICFFSVNAPVHMQHRRHLQRQVCVLDFLKASVVINEIINVLVLQPKSSHHKCLLEIKLQ